MNTRNLSMMVIGAGALWATGALAADDGEWHSLFNGHDLTGWGLRPTTDQDRADIENWRKNDPNMPPWPIVAEATSLDGKPASTDGRYAAINGRLVVTTPTEGRRIQLWVNGVQTVDYVEEDASTAMTGVIAVQIHGGPPSEAWYKDITLLDLSSK